MATATAENSSLIANQDLLRAITTGVENCLTMCDSSVKCVGMSTIPTRDPGIVTGMIGVHGQVSGFITVNMAEYVARKSIAGLLQDEFDKLTPQVIDGVGEMTNIISGGIKNAYLPAHALGLLERDRPLGDYRSELSDRLRHGIGVSIGYLRATKRRDASFGRPAAEGRHLADTAIRPIT